jgi:glycosyltransferase involved in cell wall biosynthesis
MLAVGDLSGSGGAERQFSDLFDHLRRRGRPVTLITSASALRRLRAAGRLDSDERVVSLPLGDRPAGGIVNTAWATVLLLFATVGRGYDNVHVALPTPSYVPYLAALRLLPKSWRPRTSVTVIDCTLAENLRSGQAGDRYEQQVLDAHRLYLRWTRPDGVFSWYRSIVSANATMTLWPRATRVTAARFCFTDPAKFSPAPGKAPLIVWAGRLSVQKRPLLFVDAVAELARRGSGHLDGWRFEMYGRGPLEQDVAARIRQHGLADVLSLSHSIDMAAVFARSRVFVSTQAFENFTSLAMLEAMAAGNAVIAEDVGQTREFVRPGENGLVVSPATPSAFADAIERYLLEPATHERMAAASRKLATEVHTVEHFADDITAFWADVCQPS